MYIYIYLQEASEDDFATAGSLGEARRAMTSTQVKREVNTTTNERPIDRLIVYVICRHVCFLLFMFNHMHMYVHTPNTPSTHPSNPPPNTPSTHKK